MPGINQCNSFRGCGGTFWKREAWNGEMDRGPRCRGEKGEEAGAKEKGVRFEFDSFAFRDLLNY